MGIGAFTCRSYYSLLRGSVSPKNLTQTAQELGYQAIALADVNAMYGAVDFAACARDSGILPVLGVEILTDFQRAVLLAENRAGYENLCAITTARNLDPDFDLLKELEKSHVGIICICQDSQLLKQLRAILPKDSLFAACPNSSAAKAAIASGLAPVASDCFNILDDNDARIAEVLTKVRQLSVTGPGSEDHAGFHKLIPRDGFENSFRDCPEAIANNRRIVGRCDFDLLDSKLHLPKVRLPNGASADRELGRLSYLGLARKYHPLKDSVLRRLAYELSVIKKNQFSDYFLVVKRIVDFAGENNIPVDVRGSAAGSLVSHVLGFTRVCPMENHLYFERFMNPGRLDCPDIDIDLCWRRRDEVIKFCYENWGYDHVAMICNINRYRPKSALTDMGRVLGFDSSQIRELVRNRHTKDASPVYELARRLQGIPRHIGVHCGGIVITPRPVRNFAPLQWAAKGIIVTQYDKDAAEAAGLVKIDLLGNRSLSTVHETVNIMEKKAAPVDIDHIPPNDEKTAEMLSNGDNSGVFQCESPGMRQLLRGLKVRSKKDVGIALSLIRPGPAAGGMKAEYIERHVHKKPFEYLHPRMRDILGDTYGVMLYQEDVMKIAVDVGGYSVAEADRFRSEVSKKVSPGRLERQHKEFVYSRAVKADIDRATAEAIWEQILSFAAYSYCRAHATVYANIAWQTAFLKAHFPQAFYTALLNNHHGMYPVRVYVWDAIRRGIRILPPHVNKSDDEWSVEGKAIRAGLNTVAKLSHTQIHSIIRERTIRPFASPGDFSQRISLSKPEFQNLIHVGACDGLGPSRPEMMMQLHHKGAETAQLTIFDCLPRLPVKRISDYDRRTKLQAEVDVTGIPFCMHPELFLTKRHVRAKELGGSLNRQVTIAGFIATARQAVTSDGRVMAFATIEDSSGLAEVSFFPDDIEKYHKLCSAPGPVWVSGRVTEHLSSLSVQCQDCGRAT